MEYQSFMEWSLNSKRSLVSQKKWNEQKTSWDTYDGKNNIDNHIIKVCATELTFTIFTWKSIFITNIIKNHESYIYQIKRRTKDILGITFQSYVLQVSWFSQPKIFSSILFELQAFLVSGHLLDSYKSIFEVKNNQRKLFSFFLLFYLTKVLSFSLFFFFFQMSPNDYLPKTSHLKRESHNGLIGLLWKTCWAKIF